MNKNTPFIDRAFDMALLFLIAMLPLVWTFEFTFVAYYPKLLTLHLGLALLYLIWICQRPQRSHYGTSILTLPIIALTAWSIIASLQVLNHPETLLQLSHHIAFPLFFWIVVNHVRSQHISRYISCAVYAGIFSAAIGIIQYAGWGFFWIPSAGFPSGTLGYRNYAAMYTILCIPLGLMRFVETRRLTNIWFWGMGTTLLITFLFCTRTRGAWVGLALAFSCAIIALFLLKTHDKKALYQTIFQPLSRQHLAPAITCIIITISFLNIVPPNMEGRGFERNREDKTQVIGSVISILDQHDESNSTQNRLDMWQNSLALITDHPLLGVGLGNWQYTYPAYDGGDVINASASPKRPHNDYIWIASELGLPGLLIYLYLLGTVFMLIARQIRTQNRSRVHQPLCIGISLLALATHACFSFPRERIAVSLLFWLLITCIAISDAENRPRVHHPFWKPIKLGGLAIVLLCLITDLRALRFDQHFYRAVNAQEKNDWHLVLRETNTAMKNGIFDPQILLLRGVAHAYLGNLSQALIDNQACLNRHPYFLNGLNNMGALYNSTKQYQKAHDILLRALEIDPGHGDAHASLGIAYQGLGNLEDSVTELEKAFSLDHNTPNTRTYLGKAYYSLGEARRTQNDTAGAIAAYTAFLNIWQGDANSANVVRARLQALQTP